VRAGVRRAWLALLAWATLNAVAADFASPGGAEPANVAAIADFLRSDPYDLELLISFGTSKGGSAGHLALAIRGDADDVDDVDDGSPANGAHESGRVERVYSANFYADRQPEHASGYYTDALMLAIPKDEYLFATRSTLAPTASFGLDFGEVYKRSVVGVRVYGVPRSEKRALAAYFARINDDYRRRATDTEYHDGEVSYDYMRLNCAKTIASAFHFGAGYTDVDVSSAWLLKRSRLVAAAKANIPTETAIKLMRAWNARGYAMDVVLYEKYADSAYVDPHDDEPVAFKDLPNRFPSVLSRDFRSDAGEYEDYDNLLAMYLLANLGKYNVRVNAQTQRIEVARRTPPMPYALALERASDDARADSTNFRLLRRILPRGKRIGDTAGRVSDADYRDDPAVLPAY
jgi:hypothetical protein